MKHTLIILVYWCCIQPVFAGEVDVIAVELSNVSSNVDGREYQLSVTLAHSDTGWDHYANAWEVLDEQGQVIGERVLHHPHVNEQPFTRSLRLTIPPTVKTIQLRGKDSVHEYGGKTVFVNIPSQP